MAGELLQVQRNGTKVSINNLREEAWKVISGGDLTGDQGDLKELFQRVPWLQRGITLLGSGLGALPFVILNAKGDEIDNSADYQNVTGLWADPFTDLWRAEAALSLFGAAYYLKQTNRGRKALGLRYLVPSTIRAVVDAKQGLTGFERRIDGGTPVTFKLDEIVHMFYPDAYSEIGPPSWSRGVAAMAAAGVLRNVDAFAADFFKKGMIKTTLLSVSGGVSEDQLGRISSIWGRIMRGAKSAFSRLVVNADQVTPVVIGEGIAELSNNTLSAEKREDISTALGIPHSLLFSNAANFATAEQDKRNFYQDTIIPDSKIIAGVLNAQYFQPSGYTFRFVPENMALFQEEEKDRSGAFLNMVNAAQGGDPLVVSTIMQMLGFELPGGMEWPEFEKLLAEAAPAEPEPNEAGGSAARPVAGSVPRENADGEEIEPDDTKAMYADLKRWQTKALKHLKTHQTAGCGFVSDFIPEDTALLIAEMLDEATTPAQVRAIFALEPTE